MDEVDELVAFAKRYDTHPFPYDDVFRLMSASEQRGITWTDDMTLTGDLDTYLSDISGLARGGIRQCLTSAAQMKRAKDLLAKRFLDQYPEYRMVWEEDMSAYPELNRELCIGDYCRYRLLAIISKCELDALPL